MTETKREQAIRLATTAGIFGGEEMLGATITERLERLIELAKAEQREADALICEEVVEYPPGYCGAWEGYGPVKTQRDGKDCAAAIRNSRIEND